MSFQSRVGKVLSGMAEGLVPGIQLGLQVEQQKKTEARQATQDVEADKNRIRTYFATDPAGALSQAQAKGYTELVTELEGRRSGQMQQMAAGVTPTPEIMAPMTSVEAGTAAESLAPTIKETTAVGAAAARFGLSADPYTEGAAQTLFDQQKIQRIQETLRRLENTTKMNEDARAAITGDVVAAYVDAGFTQEDAYRALNRNFKLREDEAFTDALNYMQAGVPIPDTTMGALEPTMAVALGQAIEQGQEDENMAAVLAAYKYATSVSDEVAGRKVWDSLIEKLNLPSDSPAGVLAAQMQPMAMKAITMGSNQLYINQATQISKMIAEHSTSVTAGGSPDQTTFGILYQTATGQPLSSRLTQPYKLRPADISAVTSYLRAKGEGKTYTHDEEQNIPSAVEEIKKAFPAREKDINKHLNIIFTNDPSTYAKLKIALEQQGFIIEEKDGGPKIGRSSTTPDLQGFFGLGQESTPRAEKAKQQAASSRAILEQSFMPVSETVVQAGRAQQPQRTGNNALQGGG